MVFGAEEQIMKLYDEMPTHVLAEYKTLGDSRSLHGALRHAYPKKEPTSKLWLKTRSGTILVFLQNNTGVLSFIL